MLSALYKKECKKRIKRIKNAISTQFPFEYKPMYSEYYIPNNMLNII